MSVAVVEVWSVRMVVLERFVSMPVRVRPAGLTRGMRVAMMPVMHVDVGMLDRLVRVAMAVRFAEEAADADGHQRGGEPEPGKTGSESTQTAAIAPMNGAVAK